MRALSHGLVVVAGLMVQAPAIDKAMTAPQACDAPDSDPRLARVEGFLQEHKSPIDYLAEDFLVAADRNGLDWRLLPTLAIIESGGGRTSKRNNIFGWDNGKHRFPSVRAGIHAVAAKLANSKRYRDKDLHTILGIYNTNPTYKRKVLALMRTLGPAELQPLYALD